MVEKLLTYKNFTTNGTIEGISPFVDSIVTAVPLFFSTFLFLFWIGGALAIYFIVLKTTGNKRFWESLTGMSFTCLLTSLIIALLNTETITYLSGYWVVFYIIATLVSWLILSKYK